MTQKKLVEDTVTLHRFIALYCEQKHDGHLKRAKVLHVSLENAIPYEFSYHLCEACENTLLYSYERLQNCPHVEKPSCRKCPNPCYEKSMWKKIAGIMMYSGMRLGLTKIRKLFSK